MRRYSRNVLFDRLHKGVVYTCMGLTIYGFYLFGIRVQHYWTVIRPERQLREAKLKEQLLREGKELQDPAQELTT
ncbi:uncharacterized protein LOC124163858 [Ischnura elegans]|uniref:uncharacterized protein LOC124163858 n=1 Tax=Ischnura elegans TaxID=197161 RepID=UPI001ED886B1|nr:uncharacterized protein LOC124163858 [Ischnura elegans]